MAAQKAIQSRGTETGAYRIRWYENRDRAAFLDLYRLAFSDCSDSWFAWKYEQNPYADDVPVVVAERDGEIAAVRPYVPLPLRLGDRTATVHQLVDLVVHPDHRRNGLMADLSRWLKTTCWDDAAATITYATEAARRGVLKMDTERWTDHGLGEFVKYERINDIEAFVGTDQSLPVRVGATAATPAYRMRNRLRDRFAAGDSTVTVTRHEAVPVNLLSELYEATQPATAHVERGATFYGWRFAEPGREFVTYVAERDAKPVAAVVVSTDHDPGTPSTANLVEVLPLDGGSESADAFSALLSRITADYSWIDHLCAAGGTIPPSVFAAHGFERADTFPISRFVDPIYRLVCPLGAVADDPGATARLTGEHDWMTSLCIRLLG
ncbi:GNAT family N-acetyltransferase [Halobacterium zhouii]|uniref:GNAT family N-acetyltransferase n=1 Tax=Halobacterium zhouii TaxID=2902624 RepID=UPI001E380D25|nr:GNAT family N-acetyltransferase [Halobacterium zhouii]